MRAVHAAYSGRRDVLPMASASPAGGAMCLFRLAVSLAQGGLGGFQDLHQGHRQNIVDHVKVEVSGLCKRRRDVDRQFIEIMLAGQGRLLALEFVL